MALSDEVTGRISAQELITLTNPSLPSATSVDATRLGYACTDTVADLATYGGLTFDLTNAQHVAVAIARVVARLMDRRTGGASKEMGATRMQIEDLAKATSRGRILPQTNSPEIPTSRQNIDGTPVRPDFDRSRWPDFMPGAPPAVDPWNQ